MKLVIFSICKDEAETIGQVLDGIPKKIKGVDTIETWVISDGSSDATVEIARARGANVYEDTQQKGLAFRFRQALDIVLSQGADIAVNIDGDLQFNPADIPKLVAPILDDGYDFAAADRFTDPQSGKQRRPVNMPPNKYWANRLGAWVVGYVSRETFRDVTCGFRAYSKKAMLSLNLNSKFTYTQESFQQLASKSMSIKSVPVEVKYYKGRKSRVVTSFMKFLFSSSINILRAFRDFAPLRFFGLLGLAAFIAGVLCVAFLAQHWLQNGQLSPYKSVGFAGAYFISIALFVWGLGLIADMFNRALNNQEKILEENKRIWYEMKRKGDSQ